MNKHKPLQKNKNHIKVAFKNITAFITSASPCKGGHMPIVHVWCLPLTDVGQLISAPKDSVSMKAFLMEQRLDIQHNCTPMLHDK